MARKFLKRALERQEDAFARQSVHNNLSTEQKIAKLDKKFGAGIGAKKERAKLKS